MRLSILLTLLLTGVVTAQELGISLTLKGTITTDTRFTYDIDKVNSVGEERTLTSSLGYGADVRWNILWDRFSIGLSVERVAGSETRSILYPQFDHLDVPTVEGFTVTAVEVSGYYTVPLSSEQVRFYLGGGLGTYDGTRDHSIAGVRAETLSELSSMGIHVLTGVEYRVLPFAAFRFEMKFRDPHFDVATRFEQASVQYRGHRIPLPQSEEVTKVNLAGVNYVGGLVITL